MTHSRPVLDCVDGYECGDVLIHGLCYDDSFTA